MADLFQFVVELIVSVVDFAVAWRFYVSLLLSLALAGGICWLVADDLIRAVLSIPVVIAGAILGLAWERTGMSCW